MSLDVVRTTVLELPDRGTVQFSEPLSPLVLDMLAEAMAGRPDLRLRAHGRSFDPALSFLDAFPNLHRLAIDLWHCESFEPVRRFTDLVDLGLGETRSTRPSLTVLERLPHLQSLWIERHSKNFEAAGTLRNLRSLSLRTSRILTLQPLADHPTLEMLSVSFGGLRDLGPIASMPELKAVSLHQVRQFRSTDLEPIAHATGLRTLELQHLPRLTSLDLISKHPTLQHVHLEAMRGIESIAPLGQCPYLEFFVASGSRPGDQLLSPLRSCERLQHVSIGDVYPTSEIEAFLSGYAGITFWYRGEMLRGGETGNQGVWGWNFWDHVCDSMNAQWK